MPRKRKMQGKGITVNYSALCRERLSAKTCVTENVLKGCRQLALVLIYVSSVLHGNTLELIRKIPHSGYSEGLDYHEGYLWNAFPQEIKKIDPKDGTVVAVFKPASEYSESLAWVGETLWNVSFSDNGIYTGKLDGTRMNFQKKGTVPEVHAWGLVYDGKYLIATGNYSSKLYFLDLKTLKTVKTVMTNAKDIEDLAWDGKWIWASSFTTESGKIFRIHPETGKVEGVYALPQPEECPIVDGIAYDGRGLWVTGKQCPAVYYLKKPDDRVLTSKPPKK